MATKRILVLANSIKRSPSRCVAGREVDSAGSRFSLGRWIRPVSLHGKEGALSPAEITLTGGSTVAVMDFVEIPVTESQGDPCQPENWIISDSGNWKCLNQLHRKPPLDLLEEKPNGLWLEKLQPTDRVSHEWLMKTPPRHSVCCIRTEKLRLLFYTNALGKPCRRAGFACHSIQYDLALTDPIITDKYCPHVPRAGQPMKDFRLVNCLICVSLAGEFNGYHYKVVATVFEQDE